MPRSDPAPPEAMEAAYAYAAENGCAPVVWCFESWRRLMCTPPARRAEK